MNAIIRMVFPAVAYLCVGTVITIAGGFGYLRFSDRLDDERMFQILSLLHGIDLEEIAEKYEEGQEDVPPEGMSYGQQQERVQLAILNRQGKRDDLKKLIDEFDSRFKKLNAASGHYENFKEEVRLYLEQRKAEAIDSGIVSVRGQLQNLNAKKQAKPLLKKMIDEDRMDDVILLLNYMPKRNRTEILLAFDSEEEIDMIYEIEKRMLRGDPERSFVDGKLRELQEGRE
ncbi:MAG: hypothetical protein GXP28_02995 [Planctomycetes bacterium]|nr:hypothetical protein [Planctomycetota bacterium]